MTTEIINEENFDQYFRDVRQTKPEKDDIIAKYSAMAEFVDGGEKRQIISLLATTEGKMEATTQIMRKLLFASEKDALKIPRLMAEDLISGMSCDEVAEKPYKYKVEMFYYTKKEHMPMDDPHWSTISIVDMNELDSRVKAKHFTDDENQEENDKIANKNEN